MAKRSKRKQGSKRKATVAKREAARPPAISESAPPSGVSRARIRMYRHGLGDCHLVRLPRKGARDFVIMIDCGVVLGTDKVSETMSDVVRDVKKISEGVVDLLIVTHEHWDHLSGFLQAAEEFNQGFRIETIWFAWTENPEDLLAQKLKTERDQSLAILQLAAQRMAIGGNTESAEMLDGMLEFFGVVKGKTTKDALAAVRKLSNNIRYCRPEDNPVTFEGLQAKFYVLGPPADEAALKKILPSKAHPETYDLADQLRLDIGPALTNASSPFSTLYAIPESVAQSMDFFQAHYWKDESWRQIDGAWLTEAADLALQLDSATNNTSLVIAIELEDGDVLLFAGDAQVGNWLSWQKLKWTVEGREVSGPSLLRKTIFYKVGHHGSRNATLRQLGLEQMDRLKVAAIPVNEEMAKKKGWGHMPSKPLVSALNQKTNGFVLRSDADAPATALNTTSDKLFFEVNL
jgi:hypothetical protein